MKLCRYFSLAITLAFCAAADAQSSRNYEEAEVILVQTERGVLWYSSYGDFLLLKSLIIEVLTKPTITDRELGTAGYSLRIVGNELDQVIHIGESTISDGAVTYVLTNSIFERFDERIKDRLNHLGATIPNKNITDFGHGRVLEKALRNPPNKALELTLDPAAPLAGAKEASASSAAELGR